MSKLIEKLDSYITNSNMLILLDPGHGGVIKGKYTTAPYKMYKHSDDFIFYEGVFNRKVNDKLKNFLRDSCISFIDVVSSNEDIPLSTRVDRANELYSTYKDKYNVLYLSIHGNAGGGTGLELYTSVGETDSDKYADIIAKRMMKTFPEKRFRTDKTDGDLDKEAQFYVLRNTWMSAVLTENFFFDRLSDALLMDSEKGQEKIALYHLEGILIAEANNGV